jgi:hypothetical protein
LEEGVRSFTISNYSRRSSDHAVAAGLLAGFSAAYPLYGDGDRTVVVKYPFGRGEVLWWASATPLTNAGLKEPGNLEFFSGLSRRSK